MQGGIEACLCVVTKKGRIKKNMQKKTHELRISLGAMEYVGSMGKGIGIKLLVFCKEGTGICEN